MSLSLSMYYVLQTFFQQLRTAMSAAPAAGPIATRIREKLTEAFIPQHLDVLNESYMHNVPKGAETHFKVRLMSWQLVLSDEHVLTSRIAPMFVVI